MQDEAPSSGDISGMRDRVSSFVRGIKSGRLLRLLQKLQMSPLFTMLGGKRGNVNLNIASKASGMI